MTFVLGAACLETRKCAKFGDLDRVTVNRIYNNCNTTTTHNNGMKEHAPQNGNVLFEDDEMPKGLREPFIKTGYRRAYSTPWQCFKSLILHQQ
ncbi:hypothetical protein ACROYT_G023828 [Oculina patagonica]